MQIADILQTTAHRELPLPLGPWVMAQGWYELLFAHWPIPVALLQPLMPKQLHIDTFAGEAWIGVVPFRMSNIHPRGLPAIPGLSSFPELNVRTYVRSRDSLHIPGVYFFSLDAGNPIAVAIARSVFHLPYFNASMQCRRENSIIHYASQRTHRGAQAAAYKATYRPTGPVIAATPDSIERWLTERYSLYTVFRQQLYRGDIHHVLWPLQLAEAEVEQNTMALSHGIHLPDTKPLLHYAEKQEVLIWPLKKIAGHVGDKE